MKIKIIAKIKDVFMGFVFDQTNDVTIGREVGNAIAPLVNDLSRHHAHIFFKDGAWFVEDLGSTNGSFLKGEKITGSQKLSAGDSLRFGLVDMTVEFIDEIAPAAAPTPAPAPKPAPAPAPAPAPKPAPAPAPTKPASPLSPITAAAKPAPAPAPVAKLEPIADLEPITEEELKKTAAPAPAPTPAPAKPAAPTLRPGLKLPPRPGFAGIKKPVIGGLKPGLKLPPKPGFGGLKTNLKLPPKPGPAQ